MSIQSNSEDYESEKIQLRICINEKTEDDAVKVAVNLQKQIQEKLEMILSKEADSSITDSKENVKVHVRTKLSPPRKKSATSLKTSTKLSSLTENLRKSLQISGERKSPLYAPCCPITRGANTAAAATTTTTDKSNTLNSGKDFPGVIVPLNAMNKQQQERYKFEVKSHHSPIM
ncbi:hypothetical protein BLA29_010590, partial [Euroglyphus maynei]